MFIVSRIRVIIIYFMTLKIGKNLYLYIMILYVLWCFQEIQATKSTRELLRILYNTFL